MADKASKIQEQPQASRQKSLGSLGGPSAASVSWGDALSQHQRLEKPPLLSCFLGPWAERPPTPGAVGAPGGTLPAPRPARLRVPAPGTRPLLPLCPIGANCSCTGPGCPPTRPPTARAAGSGGKTGKERLWFWSCQDRAQPGTELTALRPCPLWFAHTKQTGPTETRLQADAEGESLSINSTGGRGLAACSRGRGRGRGCPVPSPRHARSPPAEA